MVDTGRRFHWAWVVLGTCFINLFINYSVRLGYGVVLPEMIRDLGFSRTGAGSIYNSYLLTYVAITPFTGYLTDRLGARRVITVCILILGLGVMAMGSADSLLTACLSYAVVGLGATGMWTSVVTVVQRWFVLKRRGLALGILSTGYGFGFASMGLAFPWIVGNFNWRFAWYILGAGALIMVAVNALLLKSDPESSGYSPWGSSGGAREGPKPEPVRPQSGFIFKLLKDPTFWRVGFSYFCISYSLYGITTFMVDFAKVQLMLPLAKASYLATIHGIGQVVGVLTILPLSDYLGRKKTVIMSNFFILTCLIGILFCGGNWIFLYSVIGVLAIFYGATFPMYSSCAGDYFPRAVMGTVIGAWVPFYGLGAITVHWVVGLLRDVTGNYHYAFIINAVMALIGLVLFFGVKKADLIDSLD